MLGWIFLGVIFCFFILDCLRFGWRSTAVSSFWVFTLFFSLSYPIKYLLIFNGIEYQAPTKPEEFDFSAALIISACFWFLVYLFKSNPVNMKHNLPFVNEIPDYRKTKWSLISLTLLLFMIIFSAAMFYDLYKSAGSFSLAFHGNEQNEARVGHGHYFLLYTLYFKAFMIALFCGPSLGARFFVILVSFVAVLGVAEMVLLGARRPIYLIGYSLILLWAVRRRSSVSIIILGVYPVVMAALSPLGQVLRYSFESVLMGQGFEVLGSLEYLLISIGSTFEGIEHLANFLSKVTTSQLIFGIDQGISWLFNSGVSLIPRALWESKPYLYGSVAQQEYLYPVMYQSGSGQTTLPPGIVVDAMFGFGIVGLFIFSFIYAKIFKYIDKVIFQGNAWFRFDFLIAAIIYINMFNLVRGGTAMVMMVVMLMAFAIPIRFLGKIRWGRCY